MAPSSSIQHSPADHATSNELLPEEVFGHIDVATLANIHLYLRESELQDDIELATWIQENYLHGIEKGQLTTIIRTAQGFAQLDRAFRRVRSLTNKAQDKWPFLDRNFKQMSSAMVRSNARGEAAPGVMYPIDSTQKRSLTSSAPDVASPTLQLQVPFSSTTSSHSQSHKQEDPRPARQTPVPLSSNLIAASTQQNDCKKSPISPEQPAQVPRMGTDTTSESDGIMSQTELPSRVTLSNDSNHVAEIEAVRDGPDTVESTYVGIDEPRGLIFNSEDTGMEPIRDTGGGKVRGPNGRYLPREDVFSGLKKVKKLTRNGPKLRVKISDQRKPAAAVAGPGKPQSVSTEDENVSVTVLTPSTPRLDRKIEEQNAEDAMVVPPESDTSLFTAEHEAKDQGQAAPLSEPTPAYLLAAEADAVASNLDRLPPNSRKTLKRKSEPVVQSGERKRGRYGGIVGRPRKSPQRETKEAIEGQTSTQKNKGIVEALPQMTTRRSTRHSAAASLETSEPSKPAAKIQKKGFMSPAKQASSRRSMEGGKNEQEMTGSAKAGAHPKPDFRPSSVIPVPPTKIPDHDLLGLALGKTNTVASHIHSGSYRSPYQPLPPSLPTAPQNTRQNLHMANGVEQGHPPGHVELIARLTTGNGVLDIPISADQINSDEAKIIKKYAEWNAQPNAVPIPYDQFRQLFSFVNND